MRYLGRDRSWEGDGEGREREEHWPSFLDLMVVEEEEEEEEERV